MAIYTFVGIIGTVREFYAKKGNTLPIRQD